MNQTQQERPKHEVKPSSRKRASENNQAEAAGHAVAQGVTGKAELPEGVTARLWRLETVALTLGVDRRTVERLRSAGRFPRPDIVIGRMPLWRPATIDAWIEAGGAK